MLALTLSSCNSLKEFFNIERDKAAFNKIKFTVNESSPNLEAGVIEAQFNRAFPSVGIAKQDVKASYFPFEDAVCLEYRSNTINYFQYWNRTGRDAFIKALEKYKLEYSTQKLRNKNNKTKTQYGIIKESYLRWQSMRFTRVASGNMEMELGYYFKDGSPFFAVTQLEAFFESPVSNAEGNEYSPQIPIYFTRAQADELAAIFDQDFLVSLTPSVYLQAIQQNSSSTQETFPADFEDY
jgi:hypothetical protein